MDIGMVFELIVLGIDLVVLGISIGVYISVRNRYRSNNAK